MKQIIYNVHQDNLTEHIFRLLSAPKIIESIKEFFVENGLDYHMDMDSEKMIFNIRGRAERELPTEADLGRPQLRRRRSPGLINPDMLYGSSPTGTLSNIDMLSAVNALNRAAQDRVGQAQPSYMGAIPPVINWDQASPAISNDIAIERIMTEDLTTEEGEEL